MLCLNMCKGYQKLIYVMCLNMFRGVIFYVLCLKMYWGLYIVCLNMYRGEFYSRFLFYFILCLNIYKGV